MTNRANRTVATALVLALAGPAAALAAGPLNGKTYEGGAPSFGVNAEGHRLRTHATGNIVLRVAANGKSVTIRFTSSAPILYCNTPQLLHVQSTKAAPVSAGGTFKAAIAERFAAGPGPPAIVQIVTGHFSGHAVSGSISTHAAECGGVTSYSARAR
jgi:hypothetical protein